LLELRHWLHRYVDVTRSTKPVAVLKAVDIVEDPAEADEDKQEGRQEHTSESSEYGF
jgi:hypothetical protein